MEFQDSYCGWLQNLLLEIGHILHKSLPTVNTINTFQCSSITKCVLICLRDEQSQNKKVKFWVREFFYWKWIIPTYQIINRLIMEIFMTCCFIKCISPRKWLFSNFKFDLSRWTFFMGTLHSTTFWAQIRNNFMKQSVFFLCCHRTLASGPLTGAECLLQYRIIKTIWVLKCCRLGLLLPFCWVISYETCVYKNKLWNRIFVVPFWIKTNIFDINSLLALIYTIEIESKVT